MQVAIISKSHVHFNLDQPLSFVDPSGQFSMPAGEGARWSMTFAIQQRVDYQNSPSGITERERIGQMDIKLAKAMGALFIGAPIAAGLVTLGGPMLAAADVFALNVGTKMVLNPRMTAALGGVGTAVLDRSFNLKTGFPNMNPVGAFSEFITNQSYDFVDSFSSDFGRANIGASSDVDLDIFDGPNPYADW